MAMNLLDLRQLAGLAIILTLVVVAVLLVRSRLAGTLRADAEPVAAVAAAVIAVYGLILGLTLAAAWERYHRADESLTAELSGLFILSRMAYNWPDQQDGLQRAIIQYGRAVSQYELTGQNADDMNASVGRAKIRDIYLRLAEINNGPAGNRDGLDPAWQTLSSLDEARGLRLSLTRIALPDQFWGVLYLGGVIALIALVLINPVSQSLHMGIAVGAAALLVLTLALLRDLDAPYQGANTVDFMAFSHGVDVLAESVSDSP